MLARSPRVDTALLRTLGAKSAPCMDPASRWVHRRVEAVSWIDARVWRRRVSIDFTIPHGLPAVPRRGGRDLFYVPVASLQKWPPLLGLDLQARGLSTHLLTSPANGVIDEALLYAIARRTMGTLFAPRVRDAIATLAKGTDLDLLTNAYDEVAGAIHTGVDVARRNRLLALADTMVRANPLWFPVLGHHGERHVVKFSYDEEIQVRTRGIFRRTAIGLAWVPQRTWVELDHLGDSRSCHIDVIAPEGLAVASDPELYFVSDVGSGASDDPNSTLLDIQTAGQRLHAYVKAAQPGEALLDVSVTARRHGFVSGAWVAAAGVTLMLGLFWRWASSMTHDTAASVAILVVVPVLLGYIAVRPVIHPVAVAQVARVRDLLMISGALSVFAAIGLVHFAALNMPGCVRVLCRDLFFAELLIVALISMCWVRSLGE